MIIPIGGQSQVQYLDKKIERISYKDPRIGFDPQDVQDEHSMWTSFVIDEYDFCFQRSRT